MEYWNRDRFFNKSNIKRLVDVRSPAEFEQGHIPGAVNLPLFNNDEREIGTLYKKSGREASVLAGLDFVGPKMSGFVKEIKKQTSSRELFFFYCWRGGMRGAGMAWLF
ncbi:MAG: rhodanese-like domain-containing protein [Bacteroidales bacterium]